MSSTESIPKANHLWFTADMLYLRLEDGREVGAPLAWFPKLSTATPAQLAKWRFIGNGIGIRWEELDEDVSVKGLLQ
jgi:hypothetical protein